MSKLLGLTIVLIVAMLLGPVVINNPGYIKIVVAGYTAEMTLLGLVIALLAIVLAIMILWRIIKKLARWQHISFNFFRSRRERKARQAFASGLQAYARQQWKLASEQLQLALQEPHYLNEKRMLASYASLYAGDAVQATKLAEALTADETNSVFVQADLLLQQEQAASAAQLIAAHINKTSKEPALGQLYLQALKQAGQWQQLLHTIPKALEQGWYSKEQWQRQRFMLYPAALSQLYVRHSFTEDADYWQALPTKERKSAAALLGLAWVQALAGQYEQAEKKLVQIITLQNLPEVWPYLRQIPLGRSVLSLRREIQHWLRDSPTNGYLYAVLAYLAEQEGDKEQATLAWQKVRQYQPALA